LSCTLTTTKLPNYTALIESVLPPDTCDRIISAFNEGDQENWDRNGAPKFTQVNINKSKPTLVNELVSYTRFAVKMYQQLFPVATFMPPIRSLEQFRVKRYNSGSDDRYDTHVDVAHIESAQRYLALLFYLNDDFTGGQTQFAEGPAVIPKRGTVLVFPPYWMFPHAGLRVLTGTKYIMSTYLHLNDL